MTILQRYLLREFLKIFAICFAGLLGSYLLVDFFQDIDLFLNFPTPVRWKLVYFLLKIPLFVFHISPVAMLVATLVTLGIMSRNRELTAAKCAGVNLVRLSAPLLLFGLLASAAVFATNEFVVPLTSRQGQYVLDIKIKNRPMRSIFRQNRIWLYGEGNTIFNVQLLDPVERSLEGVTLYRFDPSGKRILSRIDARSAHFRRGSWWFFNGTVRSFRDDGSVRTRPFARRQFDIRERPEDISQYRKDPEDMNLPELVEYIRKLRRGGFNPTAYVVDMHAKVSLPLVTLVVTLLAVPFAFRSGPGGGIVASLGASLTLGFAYWIVISIGVSLGHAGKLSPLLSAWLPNVFFAMVAGYLWLNIEQ